MIDIFVVMFGLILIKPIFIVTSMPFVAMAMRYKKNKNVYRSVNNSGALRYDFQSSSPIKKMVLAFMAGYIRYFIFKIGFFPSHFVRKFIYKNVLLVKMHNKAVIYYGAEIRAPDKLEIGCGSIIGDRSVLDARNGIVIGSNVNIGTSVSIWTKRHDHRDPYFRSISDQSLCVFIGDRAWLGPNSTILHGVHIGEGAIVAAGSVVTKNVEEYAIVAGIPATRIGQRNSDLKYEFDGSHVPFL